VNELVVEKSILKMRIKRDLVIIILEMPSFTKVRKDGLVVRKKYLHLRTFFILVAVHRANILLIKRF